MIGISRVLGRAVAASVIAGMAALFSAGPGNAVVYPVPTVGGDSNSNPLTIGTPGTLLFDLSMDPIDAFGDVSVNVLNNSSTVINSMNFTGIALGGDNRTYGDETGKTVNDTLPNSATWSVLLTGADLSSITIAISTFNGSTSDDPAYSPFLDVEFVPTITGATPLPAALPLFATGMGLMGWVGWRRKRRV
jgi:hypothetical protein